MFHEPDYLKSCTGPLEPGAMVFASPSSPVETSLVSCLFDQLDKVLSAGSSVARAVQGFLDETGLRRLVDGGVQVYLEEGLTVLDADLSTCHGIYETGYILFGREEYTKAASYFLLNVSQETMITGSCIALAACASRKGLFESSYRLALAAIEVDPLHPRGNLIAGSCAWQLKDMRKAKYHLAAANRVSRKKTAYRPEQRTAQRLLLTMQFS